ncbi:iron complex outermembrane recepter protein [Enhydrobacter aerosaccus]|uniref:Iron complex outermembrane recepter protein n=2 Tax=Enhydrobacter aerosaccus TaxID=225324 RepID=A0A1T4KNZ9_9HYPH|nr:iron complex outermembrane recepter protein [Enhydrobacter aerosaccus]
MKPQRRTAPRAAVGATMIALSTMLGGPTVQGQDADSSGDKANKGTPSPSPSITLPSITVTADSADEVKGYVAPTSVGATKTGTPLLETPQTVTVITRQELDARQSQSLRMALQYAPGVQASNDADNRIDSITARGFTLDQFLDGLKLLSGTWTVPKVEPYLLDRLEILEGPSSVLYGQASPGGIVNMVSKKPTKTPVNEVQLQTGSFGRLQGAFDVGGPIDEEGHFLYRLTGVARTTDAQVSYMQEQRLNIAPAFTWTPDADTRFTLLANLLYDPKGGFWDLLPTNGTLQPNPYGQIPRNFYTGDLGFEHFYRTQAMVGYEFEHRFADGITARQNVRFNHMVIDYAAVQGLTLQSNGYTLNRQAYTANEQLDTISVDNQLQANVQTGPIRHTLLGGLDYQHVSWNNLTRLGTAPTLNILSPTYYQFIPYPSVFQNAFQTQDQVGIYAEEQARIDRWSLLLAGRGDQVSSNTVNRLTNTTSTQSNFAFTTRVGLTYLFDSGVAPYASYATSFQPTIGTGASGTAFQPTRGEQEEIGIKYQPHSVNAMFTVSAYNLVQTNVLTVDPSNPNFNVQTGAVRSRGIEVSAVGSLQNGLNFRASYSYLDNKIISANDGTVGNRLANVPANLASLWADYTLQTGSLAGFGLGGGVRYVGTSYTTNANTVQIPDYVVFDAALHYDFGVTHPNMKGIRFALNGYNIGDNEYVSFCSATGCRYGMGRTVLATLTYGW